MDKKTTAVVDAVLSQNHFDAKWYLATYPDVRLVGMDPAEHYRFYGRAMGRAPSADFQTQPSRAEALGLPVPRAGRELLEAYELAKTGNYDLSLAYANLHVPKYLGYTIETLRANAAIARGDETSWLVHLNAYLGNFGTPPVRLREGGQLLDRLHTDPLPSVTQGPLITVIMPAWNAEKTIAAAAGSILAQTWRNLELLIVDDASDDGTWGVMQQIAANDGRVRILRNKINVGPYVSKNLALTFATGDWITGHDADDWAHPQRLERHLQAVLQDPSQPRASVTFMARLDPKGSFDAFSAVNAFSFDGATRISSISAFFNAKFLKEDIGFWDGVRFGGDSEMISRVKAIIGEEFKEFQQIGMLCMSFEQSLTNDPVNGVRANNGGLSPARADYKDAWVSFHKEASREDLYIPFPNQNRRYQASVEMAVPHADIVENIAFAAQTAASDTARPDAIVAQQIPVKPPEPEQDLHASPQDNEGFAEISKHLLTHIPKLMRPDDEKKFGERGREWSWRWGYLGRAVGALFLATKDPKYLQLIDDAHDAFLALRDDRLGLVDDVRGRTLQSWGTVIEGRHNRGHRACEVESSGLMILPWVDLLLSDTKGLIPDQVRSKWLKTISEVISAHESELVDHPASGGAYFMSPWFDHKVEPLNHSHLYGAACALSFAVTGNTAHRDIALKLYKFFRHNWRFESDGAVTWAYNPTAEDKTLGQVGMRYGDPHFSATIGPELFFKASVSIELPLAMFRVGILPGGQDELTLISRSIRESIFVGDNKLNYYISKTKTHLCSDPVRGRMAVLRPHYMCALDMLGVVDPEMSEKLTRLVEGRPDLFPKGWFSGPASVMAAAQRLKSGTYQPIR